MNAPRTETPLETIQHATGQEDAMEAALAYLEKADTVQDLVAAGAVIKPLVDSGILTPDQAQELRDRYATLRSTLQHVVKMRELDGEELTLTKPARYVRTANGPSFYLTGKRADGRDFEAWAPRHAVSRWLEGLKPGDYPVRCVFTLEPHPRDPGKTMWTVTELAPPRETQRGLPF